MVESCLACVAYESGDMTVFLGQRELQCGRPYRGPVSGVDGTSASAALPDGEADPSGDADDVEEDEEQMHWDWLHVASTDPSSSLGAFPGGIPVHAASVAWRSTPLSSLTGLALAANGSKHDVASAPSALLSALYACPATAASDFRPGSVRPFLPIFASRHVALGYQQSASAPASRRSSISHTGTNQAFAAVSTVPPISTVADVVIVWTWHFASAKIVPLHSINLGSGIGEPRASYNRGKSCLLGTLGWMNGGMTLFAPQERVPAMVLPFLPRSLQARLLEGRRGGGRTLQESEGGPNEAVGFPVRRPLSSTGSLSMSLAPVNAMVAADAMSPVRRVKAGPDADVLRSLNGLATEGGDATAGLLDAFDLDGSDAPPSLDVDLAGVHHVSASLDPTPQSSPTARNRNDRNLGASPSADSRTGGWDSPVVDVAPSAATAGVVPPSTATRVPHVATINFAEPVSAPASTLSASRDLGETAATLWAATNDTVYHLATAFPGPTNASGTPTLPLHPAEAAAQAPHHIPILWKAAPRSQHYFPGNAPIRIAAASPDGGAVAIAGYYGAAIYYANRKQWRVFPTLRQERAVQVQVCCWITPRALILLHREPSLRVLAPDGTRFIGKVAQDPQLRQKRKQYVLPGEQKMVPNSPDAPLLDYYLQAYPRRCLDDSMTLGVDQPLGLPAGAVPVALVSGAVPVTIQSSGRTALVHWLTCMVALPNGRYCLALYRARFRDEEASKKKERGISREFDELSSRTVRLQRSVPELAADLLAAAEAAASPRNSSHVRGSGPVLLSQCITSLVQGSGAAGTEDCDTATHMSMLQVKNIRFEDVDVDESATDAESLFSQSDDDDSAIPESPRSLPRPTALRLTVDTETVPMHPVAGLDLRLVSLYLLPAEVDGEIAGMAVVSNAVQVQDNNRVPAPTEENNFISAWDSISPLIAVHTSRGRVFFVDTATRSCQPMQTNEFISSVQCVKASVWGGSPNASVILMHVPSSSSTLVFLPNQCSASASALLELAPSSKDVGVSVRCPSVGSFSSMTGDAVLLGVFPQTEHVGTALISHAGALAPAATSEVLLAAQALLHHKKRAEPRSTTGSKGIFGARLPAGGSVAADRADVDSDMASRPLPYGLQLAPTLQVVLRSLIVTGIISPLNDGPGVDADPLADAVALAAAALETDRLTGSDRALSALRALLHEAIEEEPDRDPMPGASPSSQGSAASSRTSSSVISRRLAHARKAASTINNGFAGTEPHLSPSAAAVAADSSPQSKSLPAVVNGISVDLVEALDSNVLNIVRTLGFALRRYAEKNRYNLEAVFGEALWQQYQQQRGTGAGGIHHGDGIGQAKALLHCSPFLEAVLALLERLGILLDTVAAVGRTTEEDHLPKLFPAAGEPRALLQRALALASEASGGRASMPLHCALSIKRLRTAASLLLLVQEYAWRKAIKVQQARTVSVAADAAVDVEIDAIGIASENLDDAAELLLAVGLSEQVVARLVGPSPYTLLDTAGNAPELDCLDATALEFLCREELLAVSDGREQEYSDLLHIVESTHLYCSRLRIAALDYTHERERARASRTAAAKPVRSAEQTSENEDAAASSSWSLIGLLSFGYFGSSSVAGTTASSVSAEKRPGTLSSSDSELTDALLGDGSGPVHVVHKQRERAPRDIGTDPILLLLQSLAIPVLLECQICLSRKSNDAFDIVLAPLDKVKAVGRVPLAVDKAITRIRCALPAEVALEEEDFAAVTDALEVVGARQKDWLLVNLAEHTSCLGGPNDPLVASPISALSAPAFPGIPETFTMQVGDVLVQVGTSSIVNESMPSSFEDAVKALSAAPPLVRLRIKRIVKLSVLELIAYFVL
jgi:hypothetical protein